MATSLLSRRLPKPGNWFMVKYDKKYIPGYIQKLFSLVLYTVQYFDNIGVLCISEVNIHTSVTVEEEDIRRNIECDLQFSW